MALSMAAEWRSFSILETKSTLENVELWCVLVPLGLIWKRRRRQERQSVWVALVEETLKIGRELHSASG